MSIRLEVWGDYALFSRPELKVERVSYDVITPSAARGILESIFWHPGLRYVIDKIYVLSSVKYANIRRNEVKSKVTASKAKSVMTGGSGDDLYINTKADIVQRAALVLKDPHYVIEAHFEMTENANASDNPGKFQDMLKRRIVKGQCYHNPYFGCREFPVKYRLFEFNDVPTVYTEDEKDLGFMLYDFDYSDKENITPMFFRAVLKNGVMDLTNCEVYK
ncbi:MAG: type I-C CRISPR-associated protein Cas5c [Phascolarctobacterium sp.]|nr:type I-C CRISPR-associated protein Cas5c [Phascolarctobacterium sp.]